MKIINPANEELIATLEIPSSEDIQQHYTQAKDAQPNWYQTPISERLKCIDTFSKSLEQDKTRLAEILTREMGKPISQSLNEINGTRARIQYFLDNAEVWLKDETVYKDDSLEERIAHEPLGVIANISAWNYPYLVGVNVFIPALIAGNVVLYKPSEYVALTGLEIEKLLHQSGIPKAIFKTVIGEGQTGEALLQLPLDGYFFTGSYKTGKHIYEKVAPKMVPCQLELGGKDPLYVSADNKNISHVAQAAVEGAFYNNGQSCCAVERIYVHQNVYNAFIEAFLDELKSLKTGNPLEQDIFFGPLSREQQLSFLKSQIKDAIDKGARLLTGGNRMEGPGYYFEPTVLTAVDHTMSVMKEESFGPIIGIQKVTGDEEAIALMKDTHYGLTAAVFSDQLETAQPILQQLNTGSAYWNCCDRVNARLPWSGRNHSGIGTTLSAIGIRTFTQPKAYHLRIGIY